MPRLIITVSGIVQGIGFRPFAHELASRLGLAGFVRNEGGDVVIEVEGGDSALDRFLVELSERAPPLARIDKVSWLPKAEQGSLRFTIEPSTRGAPESLSISPDIATCEQCLAELVDPSDRRFGYPLLNCTHCGPRLTIIAAAPYDRPRTTMAPFAMCPACHREYEDPGNRRFHAQPIACSECGPQLAVLDSHGLRIDTGNPLNFAATALLSGKIGALKGLGGYHLACDARSESSESVVKELRWRKHRDAKPFAIMVRDLDAVRRICEVSAQEEELLASPAHPIVLLRKRPGTVAEEVAPGNRYLGVMLPYTPLHHLLLVALGDVPLVVTSGNWSDEPIAYDDQDALQRLDGLADFFLTHNRPIHLRCDDSVMRNVAGRPLALRRARGYAPLPIPIPVRCSRPILALGGQLKATFALGREQQAILSHHLGDLDYYEAYRAYEEAVAHYERLFAIEPELVVHDLHPDYATTRYAQERRFPIARLAVQHHHAHLASCLAEHGLNEPGIGVIFDGTGFGPDGALWGGEFLVGDYYGYRRAAHLRYVAMPGGEQAIREPWRMALAHSIDAGVECSPCGRDVSPQSVDTVRRMIIRRFNTQPTSSAGRLFDTVAALAGLRRRVDYEGQAAMELEWLATDTPSDSSYPFNVFQPAEGTAPQELMEVDTRPLIAAVADDVRRGQAPALIARRFHSTVVEIIVQVCGRIREQTGIETVALSGGVFMNALLLCEIVPRLEQEGFRTYRHELVPPNDGGLCLGQLVIAAALQSGDNAAAAVASGFKA